MFLEIDGLINGGFISLSLLISVMLQSAFPKKSKLYRSLFIVRKDYSVLGFILLLPHVILFLIGENQYLEWNGILAAVIMIPLFVTSFIFIRKKMKVKTWQNLQVLAYAAYALIFIHLLVIGRSENKMVYATILLIYIILKINNGSFKKISTWFNKIAFATVILTTIFINLDLLSLSPNKIDNQIKNPTRENESSEDNKYQNGTFNGTALGFRGDMVEVNITIKNDTITNIEVIDCGCTPPSRGIDYEAAVIKIKNSIIKEKTTDLDM